jgi:hypothetical protein
MSLNRAHRLILLGLLVLVTVASPVLAAGPADTAENAPPTEADQPLVTPEPLPMYQCITCVGSYSTATDWGTGADCAEAESNLESQLRSTAFNFCRNIGARAACDFQLVITGQCHYDCAGYYVVDGYGLHGCLEGDFFCQEP